MTGGVFKVGLREVLLDRTFQPRQRVVNLFDIPFSCDCAVDFFEFLFQRPHTFRSPQDSVSGLAPLNRPAIIETVKRG